VIVELNSERLELPDDLTLLDLVERRLGNSRGAALVVDGAIVPRSAWPDSAVSDGQVIELITAVQGG
jgi:sulfur carrier protein